ncbi:extracellular solute-binding protein [Oceanibacterium hippocampi]|uniref:Oligopeptide-binding protein OppA n=1 Tax=Oceanibacterium hippocampi TaxID=745714 RepID=A0A1Y5RXX8_9PROT|nr:extracellular solute-binding protein [Oceanibacterium hippocampi]SLN25194.1 Oligopeptide-binding protein OppA precursor [Oceanibacterium hippocampi]
MKRLPSILAALVLVVLPFVAGTATGEARHALTTFGEPKYPAGFTHFDYVDPAAPKGGRIVVNQQFAANSFDSLNPFILKGNPAGMVPTLTFATLMAAADDELATAYGYVAESAELDPERNWVAYNIRPEARFHDGSPITAEDIVYSFETLVAEGHPQYRILLADVAGAVAEGPSRVRFDFRPEGRKRDLPLLVASLPVLSKASFAEREFNRTTLDPLLGSGPYSVGQVETGRSIVYERVTDFWARDLPVMRGRFNFDQIVVQYYRDRAIAREAFFAGEYDFREEYTSKSWATEYRDNAAVRAGLIKLEDLPNDSPANLQAYYFNMRRDKFSDIRVREALNLAFDFEWLNRQLFHNLYQRTNSIFQNSDFAAVGPPGPDEVALLEPFRASLPPEVFGDAYQAPVNDGSGNIRGNLRVAIRLLKDAGWEVRDGVLTNTETGEPFEIEFLLYDSTTQRIIQPYIRNLERLGVKSSIRVVDSASFQNRMDDFDFDFVGVAHRQPTLPGAELRNLWGSGAADTSGSRNFAGLKSEAVDALIDAAVKADSYEELRAACRALDRVIMWNHTIIGNWYKATHSVAYWDRFGRPEVKPKYDRGVFSTWWYDPVQSAAIDAGLARSAEQQ